MTKEERVSYNSKRCSPNKLLEFRGAVAVPAKDRYGKDYTRIDLIFNEGIDIKIFNPIISVRDKEIMSNRLSYLCESLDLDFKDIPPCKGGWVEFVKELCDLVKPRKYAMVYAKLTVTEEGWIELGEGRCFSVHPDMEYTDADTRFLEDVEARSPGTAIATEHLPDQEPVKVIPKEAPVKAQEEPPRERDWLDELDEQKAAQSSQEGKKPEWVEEEIKAHAEKKTEKPKTRIRAKKQESPQIMVDPLLTYRQRHPEADEPPIDVPY